MNAKEVSCRCGAVELRITGEPVVQLYCHCDDCQAAHGAAYVPVAIYPAQAVEVIKGNPTPMTANTLPRIRCAECGQHLFNDVQSHGLRNVNGYLLPKGEFKPQFHVQCQYAVLPVVDNLPHYKGFPVAFGGSDDLVSW
ncbi:MULTISPECIES: GFA family protein [Pseudomonadota]|jgi:hypothetical protein|uniref:GFA family protein n=1 Tax=Pseudomonadota TaxID=1224 RepID=UPI002330B05F|nr:MULTISPECIES: GFA family protein [Pseudomonadota]WCE93128.1 GFA family protein [Acidithiobacillus ferriphilus]